ncbi:beta-hexosaminidase [Clostridiales bacterium COT073_COT-073]|nr:beta-hexosaminidase [Clostridiales bacterium COT073_COT-073]
MAKVDLKAKPYYLDEEAIQWVEDTIAGMTLDEKIGQLFVNMGSARTEEYLTEVLEKYKFGAVRYNPGTAEEVYEQNRILQENSKIPLLIAANTESGGNGASKDGTEIGCEIKIGATGDEKYAYELGRVSGIEAAAVGCNWSFAPITDINRSWRNPIISSRTFGDDPDRVLAMSKAYMKGFMESNMICAMKHFPGDGLDERDQHLSNSVNHYSCAEWDATFGKVYSGMIEAGVHSVMAGHIMQPAYQKHFNPQMKDQDTMPASLSKELLTDLLRGKLGFNGLIVTDASHMVGMTAMLRRRDILPTAIAAGCDLFLFFNDPDEDFAYMKAGYESGVITEERMQDALRRILGLKAYLGLHKKAKTEIMPPKEGMSVIGSQEFKAIAREVSDQAITLVKNIGDSPLPICPQKHRRILLVPQAVTNPIATILSGGKSKKPPVEYLKEKLEAEGFTVTIYESMMDKLEKLPPEEAGKMMMNAYAGKSPITSITDNYDLIIQVAHVVNMFGTVQRISWKLSKGTPDIPWYVHELPTIFVSLSCPFHLADVPQVKTYINTYDKNEHTLDALVEKLLGRSEFKGIDPVDSFCGLPDTRW